MVKNRRRLYTLKEVEAERERRKNLPITPATTSLPAIIYAVDILPNCVLIWEQGSILQNGAFGKLRAMYFEAKIDKFLNQERIDLT